MKALEVKDITKKYGGLKVLRHLSLSVAPGERRAIIGPNGAGKTTLFNTITGLSKPDSGKIYIFGKNVTRLSAYHRARLGLSRTFQRNNLFFNLTLLDNINLALHVNRSPQKARDFLQHWGLYHRKNVKVKELSYGEQRQVELLLALVQSPRLMLLDEPTAGISQGESRVITRMIQGLPREVTVIIIEHDMEVVFNLADRITVLNRGQILYEGTAAEVRTHPAVKEIYLGSAGEEGP